MPMAQLVGLEVCRNLKEDPPDWLSKRVVEQIEKLGIFSLVLVSDSKIRELNKQWRGKDSSTDVLSFPLDLEPDFEETPFEVGEVIISVETAQRQAEEYGHDLKREIAFLITHGLLHILGFDHETREDEKEMFGRQKKILAKSGYIR